MGELLRSRWRGRGGSDRIAVQFVVMTLIAERPAMRAAEAGAAFGTPTIVHSARRCFCRHF